MDRDLPIWNETTSYSVGNEVIYGDTIYRANTMGELANVGNNPEDKKTINISGIDVVIWIDMGKLNAYRCFDEQNNTQTTVVGSDIFYLLDISRASSIVLFGLEAYFLDIFIYKDEDNSINQITDDLLDGSNNNLISELHINLIDDDIQDIIEYINQLWGTKDRLVVDLPFTIGTTKMIIKLKQYEENTKIGNIVIGNKKNLGVTLADISHNVLDFSYTSIGDDGFRTRYDGNIVDLISVRVFVEETNGRVRNYDKVVKQLLQLKGKNIVWIGCLEYETLTTFGFLKESRETLTGRGNTTLELEIQGLI